jgi:hypothetical protein
MGMPRRFGDAGAVDAGFMTKPVLASWDRMRQRRLVP